MDFRYYNSVFPNLCFFSSVQNVDTWLQGNRTAVEFANQLPANRVVLLSVQGLSKRSGLNWGPKSIRFLVFRQYTRILGMGDA